MARSFADIAFTPAVRDFQTRMGSRRNYAALDDIDSRGASLTARETEFIEARDGFYQASVGEGGWPYVQFRGGPAGFLRVLDERTIGYADFRGNVQYISAGNIEADGRVSLILMDYAGRRRLKVWGRARLVEPSADPALLSRLEMPAYRARVERGVVIDVEAFDWNCPQHITPRFTEAEIESRLAARLAASPAPGPSREAVRTAIDSLGSGPLPLVVRGVREVAPGVRAYELVAAGGSLPAVRPGAHLDVPVRLANGLETTRRYSLMPVPDRPESWEIAVRRGFPGGGSEALHRDYAVGLRLNAAMPGNDFALHEDARPAVLVAGGIGITPLRAMATSLATAARPFELHYAGRAAAGMPFLDELARSLGTRLHACPSDRGPRLDLDAIFAGAAPESVFYVCGPARLLDAAIEAGARHRVAPERIRFERFAAAPGKDDAAIEVVLARLRRTVRVDASQSILDALAKEGIAVPSGCRAGTCGTCATKVLEGTPDHRDGALSRAEREQASLMCPCVSRAKSPRLVLDL